MKKMMAFTVASALFISLSAQANDAQQAAYSTVKERQVSYACPAGKRLTVNYGFNKQGLPTFAEAKLDGKNWFLPINLNRSDIVSTVFGDENGYSLSSGELTLNNYHRSTVSVQNAAGEILFKNCNAKSSKKIKG